MANFDPAYRKTLLAEGGFKLETVKGDKGGQTYAGIARNYWPNWRGWRLIDNGDRGSLELSAAVREFYAEEFWAAIRGDEITHQAVAEAVFDMAVNGGVQTGVKLAQIILGVVVDGALGPKTLAALNTMHPLLFVLHYALGRIARRAAVCNRDRSQTKFLLGWLNRDLRGAS